MSALRQASYPPSAPSLFSCHANCNLTVQLVRCLSHNLIESLSRSHSLSHWHSSSSLSSFFTPLPPPLSLCQHNNCKSGKDCRIININLCNKKFAAHTFHIENKTEMNFRIQSKCRPPPLSFCIPPAPSRCSVTLCAPGYKLSFRTYFPDCCCCPSTCAVSSAALLCNTMLTATPTTAPTPSHAKCNMKAQKNFCLCLKIQNYAASFQKIKKKERSRREATKVLNVSHSPPRALPARQQYK